MYMQDRLLLMTKYFKVYLKGNRQIYTVNIGTRT